MTITVKLPYSSSSTRNSVWKDTETKEILPMKTIEQEKRGIKRIINIQFISLALIITAGGIIYGIF
jgi:hypothetical protein